MSQDEWVARTIANMRSEAPRPMTDDEWEHFKEVASATYHMLLLEAREMRRNDASL